MRLNTRQLRELIEAIEAGDGDASMLRRELEELGPAPDRSSKTQRGNRLKADEEEMTTAERLNNHVGDLFSNGITNELLDRVIEMDRNHSLKELRAMCIEAGLSTRGEKKELAAKLIAAEEFETRLPQTITPSQGKCYEDAWRFLLKVQEGELIHGTVLSEGRRIGHAWVELTSRHIWEPQTGQLYTPKAFTIAAGPKEESRYAVTEAATMAARTKNFGPWSEEEVRRWLRKEG